MNDTVDAPSRQSHRELRAAYRRAKLRQRLVGIPIALVGVALIVLGAGSFLGSTRQETNDVRVGGVTFERSNTNPTSTSSPVGAPSSLGELPMPGTGDGSAPLTSGVQRRAGS